LFLDESILEWNNAVLLVLVSQGHLAGDTRGAAAAADAALIGVGRPLIVRVSPSW
jgi:hypothetical protein